MKRYLIPLVLLAFTALLIAPLAQTMRTANTTNDLVLLSPYTINTNTYVVTEGTIGDGTATWWTFVAGDVTGPDATHLQPLLYPTAGRWVKNTGGSGGTNIFNTIYATNIYGTYNYFSNIYVTNLFVTNIFNRGGAKPMIKLGDTNIYITNTYVTINGTNLAVVNPTDGYVPYRNSATNFLDSAWYMVGGTNIGIDSQVVFGPGTTNVLYRNGTDAAYTNGAVDVKFEVLNSTGGGLALEAQNNAGFVSAVTPTTSSGLRASTHQVILDSLGGGFSPVVDLGEDNGLMKAAWRTNLAQHYVVRGFESGIGSPNHSYTDISQATTNDPVVFDQITGGTAGYSRGYSFRTNGVELFTITGTGGPSSGANWIANGTTGSDLRNGVNPMKAYVYNTYANAGVDYERGVLDWQTTPNSFTIGTEMGGTGSSRNVQFRQGGTNIFYIDAATGALLWNTDNSRDIGASGANRPRTIYASTVTATTLNCTTVRPTSQSWFNYPNSYASSVVAGTVVFRNGTDTYNATTVTGGSQGGYTRVLTNSALSDFLWISVPNTNAIGGKVVWTLTSTDGTDTQQITGETKFGAVAKGTTVTPTLADVQCPAAIAGGGTLTAVIASNVTTNNVLALGVTPTSSLTTTNILFKWRLETPSTYTVNAL